MFVLKDLNVKLFFNKSIKIQNNKNREIFYGDKKIKADFCGGNIFGLRYLANKYSGKKVTFVPYEQAEYIIMIDTLSTDPNIKSTCFSLRPGKNIVEVRRMGVKLSVLRKLEK